MNERVDSLIDWNEPDLVKWLNTRAKKGTKAVYRSVWRAYVQYTDGMTAKQLVDEAIEDNKRDPRERRDILKTRLLGFYKWMKEDYTVMSRGNTEHIVLRKGVADKTANSAVNAIRSFYGTFDLNIKFRGRERLPRPRIQNKRMQLTTADVKALIDHARSPRDRAIILTMFQGGMEVSTLCSMKYETVAKGISTNELPLKIDLFREKTGVEYSTFLGSDAVNAIKAYLNDARGRGLQFKPSSPLFAQEVKGARGEPLSIDTDIVQKVMREVGVRSGLVGSKNNGHDFCPASPHALRESFGSIMINNGVPDTIVDFWLGHQTEMQEAYKRGREQELRNMYSERERFISMSTNGNQALEEVKVALLKEIEALSNRVLKLERKLKSSRKEINAMERDALKDEGYADKEIDLPNSEEIDRSVDEELSKE